MRVGVWLGKGGGCKVVSGSNDGDPTEAMAEVRKQYASCGQMSSATKGEEEG